MNVAGAPDAVGARPTGRRPCRPLVQVPSPKSKSKSTDVGGSGLAASPASRPSRRAGWWPTLRTARQE